MEDSDGVIAKRNAFDLDGRTVTFSPAGNDASSYRFQTGQASYDSDAATRGSLISGLDDDDARSFDLPFQFPFFGNSYGSMFVNSDGNLSFTTGDAASTERSMGRVISGPPRIAGLFRDLDPKKSNQGVRILLESTRIVVTWIEVPEFTESGTGPLQTFQIRIYPSGVVELAFHLITTRNAVIGIVPGELRGSTAIVSFSEGSQSESSGAIAERFTNVDEVETVLAARRFFEAHEDAYDFLVIFNSLGVAAAPGAVAFESTLRNTRAGYGDIAIDIGRLYGSGYRLQALMNMGSLSQYPADPNEIVRARPVSGDTTLTILGHEAGHLFLAFASVRDAGNPNARPMLGRQTAHWNFSFNSEASLLEGNRICDRQAGSCPIAVGGGRFVTTATVQGYSPLDQYLMGFRPPWEVPETFLVVNSSNTNPSRPPQAGVSFDGDRRNIPIEEIIAAEGRRTPDFTVAQRRFRFAFIVIVAAGSEPSAAVLEQVDRYRLEFETFYRKASGERAFADTSLRRSLRLSMFPAAGVVAGSSAGATVSIERALEADLVVLLASAGGNATVPASVTIPRGSRSATFQITGVREGVDELLAEIPGGAYERAHANVQVLATASNLRLVVASGDRQPATTGQVLPNPIVLRVMDVNNLPYAGIPVAIGVAGGGSVTPPAPVTDQSGEVRLSWAPGAAVAQQLTAYLEGTSPLVAVKVTAVGKPATSSQAIVEAASFGPLLSPGVLATMFGTNMAAGVRASAILPLPVELGGVRVTLGSRAVPLVYVSDEQINFVIPSDLAAGETDLIVTTPAGASAPARVRIDTLSPGLFVLSNTGLGAITAAGTGQPTSERPAAPGEIVEVYATGLGAVRASGTAGLLETVEIPLVSVSSASAHVAFSGVAPGWPGGLYQVNVQIPEGTPSGLQTLTLSIGGVKAKDVQLRVR
jgi:uncharacterized protein (TIGR03437 family)